MRLAATRPAPVRCVIFDCDGVLVDSEPVCARIVAAELTSLGWPLSPAEAHGLFVGMSLPDMHPIIEARLGYRLPENWPLALSNRVAAAMAEEAEAMPGAYDALLAIRSLGLEWRVASNSSRVELAAKLARTGLLELIDGRLHSLDDVLAVGGRGKPSPDLFLLAAASAGAAPEACLVIEDSVPGVLGAIAAGMRCLGLSPHGEGSQLAAAGAVPFHAMAELPALFQALVRA